MENKIIINERFAGIFEKVMQNNDEIKRALEPKYSITKKAAYNRAVINALFSILKATSGPIMKNILMIVYSLILLTAIMKLVMKNLISI